MKRGKNKIQRSAGIRAKCDPCRWSAKGYNQLGDDGRRQPMEVWRLESATLPVLEAKLSAIGSTK